MLNNLRLREFWDLDFSDMDDYGFIRPKEYTNEVYQTFKSNYLKVLATKSQKWSALLARQNPVQKSRKLKRYIRQGIPFALRSSIWLRISGAYDLKSTAPDNFYDSLFEGEQNRTTTAMIALDINRTFPDNIFFGGSTRIQVELYNVLVAYAHHNPAIGYCQGLNYVVGMLILATKCEIKSFWLLKVLIENILKDYYSKTMEGVIVDVEVLAELIRMILPDVHEHMSRLGLPWAVFTTKWFVCLYADVLPAETVFRIWDCLFSEGSKILFRVGITLIKKYRTELLACQNLTDAAQCFKTMTVNKSVLYCHEFMKRIFKDPGNLSNATIEKLREKIRYKMYCKKEAEEKTQDKEKKNSEKRN